MNTIVDEMLSENEENKYLCHYGVKYRSGRYPWGSGENPYQHSGTFLSKVRELREKGMKETEIADFMHITTSELRIQVAAATNIERSIMVARVEDLKAKGYNNSEIGRKLGIRDTSVASYLNANAKARMQEASKTADAIRERIESTGQAIDVSKGVEQSLGVSRTKLEQALYQLNAEGYPIGGIGVKQIGMEGKNTNVMLIAPKGTTQQELYNLNNIASLEEYSFQRSGGEKLFKVEYPASLDSKRLMINYAEDGGIKKDGVIEIRRGLKDLNLGDSNYAQVRILVDDDRYLKGMCVYADDLPDGIDVRFNTNKTKDVPMRKVLKEIKTEDPNNPFGANIRANGQYHYIDENGEEKLSPINKTRQEGDWNEWAKTIPSQFLSKQPLKLINSQLELSKADVASEFDEIKQLENPVLKKKMLLDFADQCDANSIDLSAAALPRQRYQVILPLTSIKDDEVYAPNYEDGETVALIRYPHEGTFQIPILKVNNKNPEGARVFGAQASDVVGISAATAERLSGADFDGDTVQVIPTSRSPKGKVYVNSTKPLEALKDYDAKMEYGIEEGNPKGIKLMQKSQVGLEMGVASNLITDMTLQGATPDELARATKYSMCVIDAYKHKLDYKQCAIDNDIQTLKERYQGGGGASTLISQAKSPDRVSKTKGAAKVDPETGDKYYDADPNRFYEKQKVNKRTGEVTTIVKERTQDVPRMSTKKTLEEIRSLSSGTPQEEAYAEYAFYLKETARNARLEALATKPREYDPKAKETYAEEVVSLDTKLANAKANKPKERLAQIQANAYVKSVIQDNPDVKDDKKLISKIGTQALNNARNQIGAKKEYIVISDKEWEAIQNGAITPSKLKEILDNADSDRVKKLAFPKEKRSPSPVQVSRIERMAKSGFSTAEIAKAVGFSESTILSIIKPKK